MKTGKTADSETLYETSSEAHSDTRRQILRVSMELFGARGFHDTSLREIAERVGVSKPAVLYHFPGKADILAALVEPMLRDLAAALARAAAAGPAEERWAAIEGVLDVRLKHVTCSGSTSTTWPRPPPTRPSPVCATPCSARAPWWRAPIRVSRSGCGPRRPSRCSPTRWRSSRTHRSPPCARPSWTAYDASWTSPPGPPPARCPRPAAGAAGPSP
ncbi:helix-turn-helix transcriptional regulator [Streptomyces sp. ISL-66]|nr:helix-turn-helix transcriptional regulator [Streptomyces sp. ISL-66]